MVEFVRARTHNLVVNSIAGAGKTTTIEMVVDQLIADRSPAAPVVHLITYNANLKLETRQRLERRGLAHCVETHSYHSHCVKYYASDAFTDLQLGRAIGLPLRHRPSAVDVLFLDEVQDQTSLYYRYVCAFLRDLATVEAPHPAHGRPARFLDAARFPLLCLLGDSRQCIFQFNGADERFLELAPQLFAFTQRPWRAPTLTTSYRLTAPVAQFVHRVMLKGAPPLTRAHDAQHAQRAQRDADATRSAMGIELRSDRTTIVLPNGRTVPAPKPRYLVCDVFGQDVFDELTFYLNMGYAPGDIFILAGSVNSATSPVGRLENMIKARLPHIQLFVSSNQGERLDRDVLQGKRGPP